MVGHKTAAALGGFSLGSPLIWLLSVAFAALLAWLAARRDANPVFWGGLGFFFGPLPLPFLLLARRRKRH